MNERPEVNEPDGEPQATTIQRDLDKLSGVIYCLMENITELTKKLEPVITPLEPPPLETVQENIKETTRTRSFTGEKIVEYKKQIITANRQIHELMARVEL